MADFFPISRINPVEMICFLRDNNCCTPEPEHTHEFIEIEYVHSGSGVQIINGEEYQVNKGDVLLFNLGDVHSYYPINNFSVINCIFYPHFADDKIFPVDENSEHDKIPCLIKLDGNGILDIEKMILTMENEFIKKEAGYLITLKSYLDILLIKILRSAEHHQNTNSKKSMIPIIEFIENNYSSISPCDVAHFSSYNSSYFSKMFKENMGVTLTEYINKKRIDNSIRLIKDTDYTIDQICFMVGFKEKKYFYRCFKTFTGITPSMMRNKRK